MKQVQIFVNGAVLNLTIEDSVEKNMYAWLTAQLRAGPILPWRSRVWHFRGTEGVIAFRNRVIDGFTIFTAKPAKDPMSQYVEIMREALDMEKKRSGEVESWRG